MPSGVQSVSLLAAPIVASNAVFSVRRVNKGVDSINDNPVYGAMNIDIAAGQTLKGIRAGKDISTDMKVVTEGAGEAIKGMSKTSKILKSAGKIVDLTADNINTIICATSAIKVIGSEDKADTAARESLALGVMFGAEAGAKRLIGMSYTEKKNGKTIYKTREGLYKKNLFLKEQTAAIKDYCATKKLFNKIPLKGVPGVAKGLFFVGASISGFKAGSGAADLFLGEKKQCA